MRGKIILLFIFLLFLSNIAFDETIIKKVDFVDASLIDVVESLCSQAGIDMVAGLDSSSNKKITLHLKNISAEDAIEYVLTTNGFAYQKKKNSILISSLPQDITNTGYKKQAYSYESKNLSADRLVEVLSKIFQETSFVSGERANRIIIRGKDEDVKEALLLLESIDKPIPQVIIESKVLEISKSDSIKIGFDFNNGYFKFLNTKAEDVKTTLNTLLANGNAKIIASPKIAALDNCQAIINIGSRIPYAVPVSSSSSGTQWTVDYIDAGVKLKITPKIGKDNQITAQIEPEVSSISEWKTTSAGEFPVISTRNASSTLRIKTGETIAIGGLELESERVNTSRVPIIGQFPILNLIFQNRTYEKSKTEIVFLITPYTI